MTSADKCEEIIKEMKGVIENLTNRSHSVCENDVDTSNQNQRLKEENESLKNEVKKLNYRILHLKRGIEEEGKKDEEICKLKYRIKHLVSNLNGGEIPPCCSLSSSSVDNIENKSTTTTATPSPNPSFYRVKLIVGKILDCKIHEKANRLLYERIDCGENEPRTICSSVRDFYKAEDLIGKLVCVVANLKSRKFCGMMSNGMLLCAVSYDGEKETGCEVMEPADGSIPGERVYINEIEVSEADDVIDNKSDAWENIKPYMRVSSEGMGMYCGCKLMTSKGVLRCKSMKDCQMS